MKGAFIVSVDHHLFHKVKTSMLARGAQYSALTRSVQLSDQERRLLTVYSTADPEWEFRDEPITPATGVIKPDMSSVAGYAVECRWEDLFIAEVGRIAALADGETWVLDGDGVLWSATDIDINRLRL